MTKRNLIVLLIACSVVMALAGCATDMSKANYIDYRGKLNAAHVQLQNGQPSRAMNFLEEANKLAEENGYKRTELKKLTCEAFLSLGDTVSAYNQAKELLDEDPQNAYPNELMGKVLLKEGKFGEAEKYLLRAQEKYEASEDISRAEDLVALTRGLSAYEDGNPRLAGSYFRAIQNADLQYAVDKAQKDITAKEF